MKVYVSELPKSCIDCPCYDCEWGDCNLEDINLMSTNDFSRYEQRHQDCPLQSLSDYTKQVRKEVCVEIKEEVKKLIDKDFRLCNHEYANGYCYGLQYDLAKILEQIEKGETEWK